MGFISSDTSVALRHWRALLDMHAAHSAHMRSALLCAAKGSAEGALLLATGRCSAYRRRVDVVRS
jgi:hypothetical protein